MGPRAGLIRSGEKIFCLGGRSSQYLSVKRRVIKSLYRLSCRGSPPRGCHYEVQFMFSSLFNFLPFIA